MRMRLIVVLMTAMTAWAGPTWAQAGGVRVSVPFRFGVGEKTFAAGDYIMMAGSHQVRIMFQEDGKTLVLAIANDVSRHLAGAAYEIRRQDRLLDSGLRPTPHRTHLHRNSCAKRGGSLVKGSNVSLVEIII